MLIGVAIFCTVNSNFVYKTPGNVERKNKTVRRNPIFPSFNSVAKAYFGIIA